MAKDLKNRKPSRPVPAKPSVKKKNRQTSVFQLWRPLLVILPLVFIAYFPILDNELTNWDDPDLIIDNPLIREINADNLEKIFTTFYFGNYQPLHLLSYAIQYQLWELNPAGYHAVSLLLFMAITVLVFYFTYRISKKNIVIATVAALLFALNPMRVESVAWAAEHKDMLYALFYIASLITYVSYLESHTDSGKYRNKFFVYSFILFLFSVFSKVMAVSLVGAMVMLDYFYARKFTLRLVLEKLPFIGVSLAVGITQVIATAEAGTIDETSGLTFFDRILIVCRNLMFFFYKMLIPVNLSAFHPYPAHKAGESWPAEFYIAVVFVLLLIVLLIWSYRRTRLIIFCVGFFFLALALVLQYIAIGPSMFNERYSLIPAVPLSFGLATGGWMLVQRYRSLKTPMIGFTAAYLVLMIVLTHQRCNIWQNSLTLWNDVLEQYPTTSMALNNRGKYYGRDLNDQKQAYADLSAAILYDPLNEKAYNNRGIVRCIEGQFDSAIVDFNAAIRLQDDFLDAIANRGIAYAQTNRPVLAIKDFNRCMELAPGKADTYMNRGTCYLQMNQPDSAIADFSTGISLFPGNAEMYLRRSQAFAAAGRYREALADLELLRSNGRNVDQAWYDQVKQKAGV